MIYSSCIQLLSDREHDIIKKAAEELKLLRNINAELGPEEDTGPTGPTGGLVPYGEPEVSQYL